MSLKLVILGKQGAGKGTQCDLLVQRYGLAHISTGDMLRAAVASNTPLGQQAKAVMDAGDLLSDDLILGLVRERLTQPDATEQGYLLDGFPRTAAQTEGLLELLGTDAIDLVLDLFVPDEVVTQRMLARGRDDDTPDAIARRLEIYEVETAPLRTLFAESFPLVRIDGLGTPAEVHTRISEALDASIAGAGV